MFLIAALATIAMPGTNSFISEFLVLIGTFTRHPAWAIVATVGIVLAAVYMLWIFQRTMPGPVRGAAPSRDVGSGPGVRDGAGARRRAPDVAGALTCAAARSRC